MSKISTLTKVEFISTPTESVKLDAIKRISKKDNTDSKIFWLILDSEDNQTIIAYEFEDERDQDYYYLMSLWFTIEGGISPLAF
jgi:hypothetical protein